MLSEEPMNCGFNEREVCEGQNILLHVDQKDLNKRFAFFFKILNEVYWFWYMVKWGNSSDKSNKTILQAGWVTRTYIPTFAQLFPATRQEISPPIFVAALMAFNVTGVSFSLSCSAITSVLWNLWSSWLYKMNLEIITIRSNSPLDCYSIYIQ